VDGLGEAIGECGDHLLTIELAIRQHNASGTVVVHLAVSRETKVQLE